MRFENATLFFYGCDRPETPGRQHIFNVPPPDWFYGFTGSIRRGAHSIRELFSEVGNRGVFVDLAGSLHVLRFGRDPPNSRIPLGGIFGF